jgi:hypothetical protein
MSDHLLVTPVVQLCQVAAAMASRRLGDAGAHACRGASAVLFEAELAFEGLVDRLDTLAHCAEVAVAVGLVLAVRAQQAQAICSVSCLKSLPEKPLSASRI